MLYEYLTSAGIRICCGTRSKKIKIVQNQPKSSCGTKIDILKKIKINSKKIKIAKIFLWNQNGFLKKMQKTNQNHQNIVCGTKMDILKKIKIAKISFVEPEKKSKKIKINSKKNQKQFKKNHILSHWKILTSQCFWFLFRSNCYQRGFLIHIGKSEKYDRAPRTGVTTSAQSILSSRTFNVTTYRQG